MNDPHFGVRYVRHNSHGTHRYSQRQSTHATVSDALPSPDTERHNLVYLHDQPIVGLTRTRGWAAGSSVVLCLPGVWAGAHCYGGGRSVFGVCGSGGGGGLDFAAGWCRQGRSLLLCRSFLD